MTTGSIAIALVVVAAVFYIGSLVGYALGGRHLGKQLFEASKDHPEDRAALERIGDRAFKKEKGS